jgi:hypothetical protein
MMQDTSPETFRAARNASRGHAGKGRTDWLERRSSATERRAFLDQAECNPEEGDHALIVPGRSALSLQNALELVG